MAKKNLPAPLQDLTPRERNFVLIDAREGNSSRSRIKAGYKDKGSPQRNAWEAWHLKQKPKIKRALEWARQAYYEELAIDLERMMVEVAAIAFSDLSDAVDPETNTLLPLHDMAPEIRKAISEYTEVVVRSGDDGEVVLKRKVKLHSKPVALLRLLEAYPKPSRAPAGDDPKRLTREQLLQIAGREAVEA